MQVMIHTLIFVLLVSAHGVRCQSEFSLGETVLDPAAREAQVAAAEEQMAEAMSEAAPNSPERQQVEQTIRLSGGRFKGDAAALNYLIDEHTTTTTTTTPAPIKLPFSPMTNRLNPMFRGQNNRFGPSLGRPMRENGMRQQGNVHPRNRQRMEQRNNRAEGRPGRWGDRPARDFTHGGQGGRRQQNTNHPWEQRPKGRAQWEQMANGNNRNQNAPYRWDTTRPVKPRQESWYQFTTPQDAGAIGDPWLQQTTPALKVKPLNKTPNNWDFPSQKQFVDIPPQPSHTQFMESLFRQDSNAPSKPGTNWRRPMQEPMSSPPSTEWGPSVLDRRGPSHQNSNRLFSSQTLKPISSLRNTNLNKNSMRNPASRSQQNKKFETARQPPTPASQQQNRWESFMPEQNTQSQNNPNWRFPSQTPNTPIQPNIKSHAELIASLFSQETTTSGRPNRKTIETSMHDRFRQNNNNNNQDLWQKMMASQTPKTIGPNVQALSPNDPNRLNAMVQNAMERQMASTKSTITEALKSMAAMQSTNTGSGNYAGKSNLQNIKTESSTMTNANSTPMSMNTMGNARQQVFLQLFDALLNIQNGNGLGSQNSKRVRRHLGRS